MIKTGEILIKDMSKNIYYQLKKPVYGKYGFEGFEDYQHPVNTIEEARILKNLSVFGGQLEIFEITVKEQIIK